MEKFLYFNFFEPTRSLKYCKIDFYEIKFSVRSSFEIKIELDAILIFSKAIFWKNKFTITTLEFCLIWPHFVLMWQLQIYKYWKLLFTGFQNGNEFQNGWHFYIFLTILRSVSWFEIDSRWRLMSKMAAKFQRSIDRSKMVDQN
jgi:hypothetical protein